eukprot:6477113-Prymnesium_polylepis.1
MHFAVGAFFFWDAALVNSLVIRKLFDGDAPHRPWRAAGLALPAAWPRARRCQRRRRAAAAGHRHAALRGESERAECRLFWCSHLAVLVLQPTLQPHVFGGRPLQSGPPLARGFVCGGLCLARSRTSSRVCPGSRGHAALPSRRARPRSVQSSLLRHDAHPLLQPANQRHERDVPRRARAALPRGPSRLQRKSRRREELGEAYVCPPSLAAPCAPVLWRSLSQHVRNKRSKVLTVLPSSCGCRRDGSVRVQAPFVAQNQLYLSYSICPHVVLRCAFDLDRPDAGRCARAYTTEHPSCRGSQLHGVRGGSPLLRVTGQLVGVAHRSWERRMAEPIDDSDVASPTAVERYSTTGGGAQKHRCDDAPTPTLTPSRCAGFGFGGEVVCLRARAIGCQEACSTWSGPTATMSITCTPCSPVRHRDAVQFCAGLALANDKRALLISYGVADCVSLLVSKPVVDVFGFFSLAPRASVARFRRPNVDEMRQKGSSAFFQDDADAPFEPAAGVAGGGLWRAIPANPCSREVTPPAHRARQASAAPWRRPVRWHGPRQGQPQADETEYLGDWLREGAGLHA